MGERNCLCCADKRIVTDAAGEIRPCSRCDADGFNRWSEQRKPPRVGAAIACAASGKGERDDAER